jgi:O-antigen/teichoic acid export membrane protein
MFRKLLSLLSDVAVYGISSLLSQIIGFLLLPLFTRYLTPADQGVIAMLGIVTLLFNPLANLGMSNAIFRRFNLEKTAPERGAVLASGLFSVTISSLALLALGCVFAAQISELVVGDTSATNLVRLSLLTAAAMTVSAIPLVILRADRRVKTAALINVSKFLVSIVCTIWLVVVEQWGVLGVVVGTLVGEVALAIVQFGITLPALRFKASLAAWKRLASYGLPIVPHHLQGLGLSLFGQFMVGHMLGMTEAGLYSIAVKFTLPVAFVVNAVQNAWVAYKFQVHAEDEDPATFFRTAVTYYIAGIAYLWVGVSLWGPELVRLMTVESYHDAAWLVPFVGLIPVGQGLYFMMGTGMELSDNTRPFPLVSFAGLVTVVITAWRFVPWFGAVGAAAATIAGWIVVTIVIYVFSQRRFAIQYDWPTLASIGIFAATAAAVGTWSQQLPLVSRLGVAAVISLAFPLAEFGVLCRSSSERHRMRILWTKLSGFSRAAT